MRPFGDNFFEKPFSEIAREMNMPLKTVHSTYARAMKKLRAMDHSPLLALCNEMDDCRQRALPIEVRR